MTFNLYCLFIVLTWGAVLSFTKAPSLHLLRQTKTAVCLSRNHRSGHSNGGFQRRKTKRRRIPTRSEEDAKLSWLRSATRGLLSAPLSSGKHHEVVSILKAWLTYAGNEPEAPLRIQALSDRLVSTDHYPVVLEGWVRAALRRHRRTASHRAREFLVHWQQQAERGEAPLPPARAFARVLTAVCVTEDMKFAIRLHTWMLFLYKTGKNANARPKRSDVLRILQAFAERRAGLSAERFVRHLCGVSETDDFPDVSCYNLVLRSHTLNGRHGAEEAQRILDTMPVKPNTESYVTVMYAWASTKSRYAVDRVEELLQKVEEDYPSIWRAALATYQQAKPQHLNTMKRCRDIIRTKRVDATTCNTYLHMLAQRTNSSNSMAEEALAVLSELEKHPSPQGPNTFSYNLVIEACCKSQAIVSATKVLKLLVNRKGVPVDAFSFNQILGAMSGSPETAAHAETLFDYMKQGFKSGRLPNAQPDSCTYSSLIKSLARMNDTMAADRAEAYILCWERDFKKGVTTARPNRICYNALIDCWARSGRKLQAARKAESVLQRMQEESMVPPPNLVSYNAVLNAWARSGTRCCGRKAENYLDNMWELYQQGDESVKPDEFTYNTVINAISKSKDERKAQKALRLLRIMDLNYQSGNEEARPTAITYTAVLNSCAYPAVADQKERLKALDVAQFTLKELQSTPAYGKPNPVTYGTFFKACGNLLPKDGTDTGREIIKATFDQCCREGQLNAMVLKMLNKTTSKELRAELFRGKVVASLRDVPVEWRCNIHEPKTRRRRQWR